jgi:hypothetical protein
MMLFALFGSPRGAVLCLPSFTPIWIRTKDLVYCIRTNWPWTVCSLQNLTFLLQRKKEFHILCLLLNSRYGVCSSHCHTRIFVTKLHLAEAKFYKHIRVSNSLLKIILHKFFDVLMRKMFTDSGNFVVDIGLSIYFIIHWGVLVLCNHVWPVGC